MSKQHSNFLKKYFYSLRIRVIMLMFVLGSLIYGTTLFMVENDQRFIRQLSRQFCAVELKLIITQYYLYSIEFPGQEHIDALDIKVHCILSPGPIFKFISEADKKNTEAIKEFQDLYELAYQASLHKNDLVKLKSIYQESLKYPSPKIYEMVIGAISKFISTMKQDNRMFLFLLFLIFTVTYFILRGFAIKVGMITTVAQKLINKDETLQLTERLNFNSKDETIYIKDNFNIFLSKLEEYTIHLLNSSRGLVYQITQMFSASTGWKLETKVMSYSTERISRQMNEQILSVNQSAATLEEMERTLDVIFNNISRQSVAMTQAATTLEEMGRQVDGVAKISSDTAELATKLTEVADKGNAAVDASIVSIRDVAEYSSQILKLLQLISGIAKQTNLLAMNASIEAAHAGESGRGFAIVAEEIRRLSETTNKNAKEIRTVVDTMVEKIDNSVEQARIAGEDLQQINNYSENVAERISQLNNMMQQQNVATHEMITTIEGLVNLAQEIKLSMEEQKHGLHDYSNTIKDLKESFGEVKSTLDGHMSSVENLLAILTDMGIRISIQKRIMDQVGEFLQLYKVDESKQISDGEIENLQKQLFLEEQQKSQK